KLMSTFLKSAIDDVRNSRAEAQIAADDARLANMPLDVHTLITKLEQFFNSHAQLPPNAGLILALWAINTWTFDVFRTVAYLLLKSAVPSCGKSTILELLAEVCRNARLSTSLSEAVLFRIIEKFTPTLLIDEAESLAGNGDRAEALRTVANAGYKRGVTVPRC